MNIFFQNAYEREGVMLTKFKTFIKRNFSNQEAITLLLVLGVSIIILEIFSNILFPVLISIVIAYLMMPFTRFLHKIKVNHTLSLIITYCLFLGIFISIFMILPLLWKQLGNLLSEIPNAFTQAQAWLNHLAERHTDFFTDETIENITSFLKNQSLNLGNFLLSSSMSNLSGIMQSFIYLILIPLLVFFFIKDGKHMFQTIYKNIPNNQGLIKTVFAELDKKIAAYIKGRIIEIVIVASISFLTFVLFELKYPFLMAFLVGVSVMIPYIGAIIVTIPIAIISLMQWGPSEHFFYFALTYVAIITLDANLLFPLLFSEALDMHPVIIILSVLFFGKIWGFWGVFFAIPLAALVRIIITSWPKMKI